MLFYNLLRPIRLVYSFAAMRREDYIKKGRLFSILLRRSPRSALLHCKTKMHILITGSIITPVLLVFNSCTVHMKTEEVTPPAPKETEYSVVVRTEKCRKDYQLDNRIMYVYEAGGMRKLLYRIVNAGTEEPLEFRAGRGEYLVAVLANLPEIDEGIAGRYETMELVSCRFDSDDPKRPFCSGGFHISLERDTALMAGLKPLMSKVVLMEIANDMDSDIRMENPSVWLYGRNESAELMRQDGFIPVSTMENNDRKALPGDIGKFPQYPETILWCYPNEAEKGGPGSTRTGICLECTIKGKICRFEKALPEIGRASVIYASLNVKSPDEWEWTFNGENVRD